MDLPLFLNARYVDADGKSAELEIQTRSLGNQKQDAKIGSFAQNFWFRPKKAVQGIEYKTIKDYKKACTLSIKKMLHAKSVEYYILVDVDGVQYEKKF